MRKEIGYLSMNKTQKDKIIKNDLNTVKILNTIFFKIVAEYTNCDPVSYNINDLIIESVLKYRDHPPGIVIGEVWNRQEELFFYLFTYR